MPEAQEFDYLVIGGGAAGCVIAGRLAALPGVKVVLVEAGSDFGGGPEPAAIRDARVRSFFSADYMWANLRSHVMLPDGGAEKRWERSYLHGRVMGGGSSVNGLQVQRGLAADYDEMRDLGATGWGYEDVLPYFRKLETDCDFPDSPLHGNSGPMPIRRYASSDLGAFERGMEREWAERGWKPVADISGAPGDGYGFIPANIRDGERVTAARAYLTPELRAAQSLTIIANTQVRQLVIEGGEIMGAVAEGPGGSRTIRAARTVLSAGAIGSPWLLMRSGIGDAQALRAHGITVQRDARGVGANLHNHPTLVLASYLSPQARSAKHLPPTIFALNYSSGIAGCAPVDLNVSIFNKAPGPTAWHPAGRAIGSLMGMINKPYSRGSVTLGAGDASASPVINFNFLGDDRDKSRIVNLFADMMGFFASPHLSGLCESPFVPDTSGGFQKDNLAAALVSTIGAGLLSSSAAVRRKILQKVGVPAETLGFDDAAIETTLSQIIVPAAHASGTCRLGRADDPDAVVDPRCNVIGVGRLRVADASIFPTLMRAGTHIPTIMAAEKAADMIIADDRG